MSSLLKRKQKNNEVKHSIRMINQLDTENDIQINDNLDTFNNKPNYFKDEPNHQFKSSNEEYIKVIKPENKGKLTGFQQNSFEQGVQGSPKFNKQSLSNLPISQSQGFFSKYANSYVRNSPSKMYNYQSFIFNLSQGIENLSENLNKDFEDIENLIESTMEDLNLNLKPK